MHTSAFGFLVVVVLCLDKLTGMAHVVELRFQLMPRDAQCCGHIVQFSIFQGGAKIVALANNNSISSSIPIIEKADLCPDISQ